MTIFREKGIYLLIPMKKYHYDYKFNPVCSKSDDTQLR